MINKMYNERVYLNNIDLLNSFIDKSKTRIVTNRYNSLIDKYDLLITNIAKYIKKYNYDNSLNISILLSYLITNGYLSYNNTFKVVSPEKDIPYYSGINIINGEGCCRNYSSMHKNIFNKLKLYDKKLYCYQGVLTGSNSSVNHVINIISYDNNYYGIDTYNNNRLYRFIDGVRLREISTISNNKIRYKPYYELTTGESSISDIYDYLDMFKNSSKSDYITDYDYYDLKRDILLEIKNNNDSHLLFHNDNKELLSDISDEMKMLL